MRWCRGAILMFMTLSLTAQEPFGPPRNCVNAYSLEKEAVLGKQLAAELHRRTIPIDSTTVQKYVGNLGRKIAAHIPDAVFPFTFSVIARDACGTIHEPAAVPGGYVFVPAGLLVAAQDEDEFAGMLAHAMVRASQSYRTRQATGMTCGTIPLIFTSGWGCSGGHATPAAFLASQRNAESEADVLAVRTVARAGFDPKALVRYIERVQVRATGPPSAKAYSPMPDRDQRVAAMLAAIEELPKVDSAATPSQEFATARQEVRRLVERPVRSGAPPSLIRRRPE
jgi:predicted Zn-dependent protease